MSKSSMMIFGGLAFASIVLAALPSQGATEFEKFKATIPEFELRAIDHGLELCGLMVFADFLTHHQDKSKVPYEEFKAKLAACDKPISALDLELAKMRGIGPEELNAAKKRYRELFYAEQKLKYDGKPVPGYVQKPLGDENFSMRKIHS
jgi:hypothetical protein